MTTHSGTVTYVRRTGKVDFLRFDNEELEHLVRHGGDESQLCQLRQTVDFVLTGEAGLGGQPVIRIVGRGAE